MKKVSKKKLSEMANRYKIASEKVKSDMPTWKRNALDEDLSTKYNSSIVAEYVEKVNNLVEKESSEMFLQA